VDPNLEMTEIGDRVLRAGGPALFFEKPKGHSIPVLANLFGTELRVARGMGRSDTASLREIGELLAFLRQPDPPRGMRDAWEKLPMLKQVLNMAPKEIRSPACQDVVWEGRDVDLSRLPIQTCWPGDAAPLITWPLVITRGPNKERQNLGIYRLQLLARKVQHRAEAALAEVEERPARLGELLEARARQQQAEGVGHRAVDQRHGTPGEQRADREAVANAGLERHFAPFLAGRFALHAPLLHDVAVGWRLGGRAEDGLARLEGRDFDMLDDEVQVLRRHARKRHVPSEKLFQSGCDRRRCHALFS
jgi:hypothetical protein